MENQLELLSPAGDPERLDAALRFGAGAVYLAGQEFGMRAGPANFSNEELKKACLLAHEKGVKVYVTCNTLPRNEEIQRLPAFLEKAQDAGVDGLIVTDFGVLSLAKRHAPRTAVHISTQAGIVNYQSARAFYDLGASRVVLARELSLDEIAEIRAKTDPKLELEAFVHGSMCVSFSGRCLLSNYLTGRDANRGDCAQPCRWKYHLMEESRPGEYFPVLEDDSGAYFFNSRDLCMIGHLPALAKAGITSLKIEGRAKSAYYVAVVTNAYRQALNLYLRDPSHFTLPQWILDEMEKVSHREYCTGFFFGGEPGQVYDNGGYVRGWEVAAVCDGYENHTAVCSQRNRFFKGETLNVLEPGKEPYEITVNELFNHDGEPVEVAPHPLETLYLPVERPIVPGALLRRKR